MTASAVTSSAQAPKNSATTSSNSSNNFLETFIKPTNDTHNRTSNNTNTNSSWSQPFLPDLTPSIPLTTNYGGYPSRENLQPPVQSSTSSSRLSNLPLFQSYHSSMYFLRANNLAQLSPIAGAGSAIGGSHASRISSANKTNSSLLVTAQTTSHSALLSSSSASVVAASVASSSLQQGAPLTVASPVELSNASSSTTTTAISMHSASKTPPAATAPTILSTSKRPVIIIYPTVSPESIVVPIVSCIFGFPLFALLVICCLRRRAKLARERDRRRNYDMQDHAVSLVRFSPIHRLNNRSSRAISLRPERSLSRGFPSLELDTVIEERSDPEQTQTDLLSPESPLDPQKFREFHSS